MREENQGRCSMRPVFKVVGGLIYMRGNLVRKKRRRMKSVGKYLSA